MIIYLTKKQYEKYINKIPFSITDKQYAAKSGTYKINMNVTKEKNKNIKSGRVYFNPK